MRAHHRQTMLGRSGSMPQSGGLFCFAKPTASEVGKRHIGPAPRNKGHTKWQADLGGACRHRQRAPAQQIDEVGIGAQARVDAHRVSIQLGKARMVGRRGHHQHIDVLPEIGQFFAVVREPVLRGKGVGSAKAVGAGYHLAHGGVERVGLGVQQLAHHGVALSHPRAFIEQSRHRKERGHVDVDKFEPQCFGMLACALPRARVAGFDVEHARLRQAHPQPGLRAGVCASRNARPRTKICATRGKAAVSILRIWAFDHRQHMLGIAHRVGKD